jgi:hypothetical protein
MIKDKHYNIHHIIHSINNIKNIIIHTLKKIFTEQYIFLTQ